MKPALPKKILVLGSGALKIGEAGEFDYSGSQCMKALREEGIKTVLINPNIATNQTSYELADKIYFLPVNPYFAEKVIAKERPQGIVLSFGGQTALNCGLELHKKGVLKRHKVKVLGTPVAAIEKTEDRELFKRTLDEISVKTPRSVSCMNIEKGLLAAKKLGYPVIVRAAFALGGKGSGFACNREELQDLLESAFAYSPQVLIEEDLRGWKEVEYEVVRDRSDNCITVCNMENVDPLGIHTGESIVVAPSQTLTNREYHLLREISIRVIRHLGIVGECNIQFALHPESELYRVIEVNARLSRSSALASKATGYPLAHVAAKLALGYDLPSLKNSVTKVTTACFEPALDYLVMKIPRWDLDKFRMVSHEISSEMKSVGEIMAIGRSFEEVLQKGLRMLQIGLQGFTGNERLKIVQKDAALEQQIKNPTPRRILAIAEALRKGWNTEKIWKLSKIDRWFLAKMKNIIAAEKSLRGRISPDGLREAKKMGFSDRQIGRILGKTELEVRDLRKKFKVLPAIKQIDTLAAEYPAQTNYLYLTYHGTENDIMVRGPTTRGRTSPSAPSVSQDQTSQRDRTSIIVLGSGPYCIGSSVEFDWGTVTAVRTAQKLGYETVMINYNPETVSTDYDMCDKLYFDELSLERVLDIYEFERPDGVIISTGGQVPNNLSLKLHRAGVKILGTSPVSIDRAEDRRKFSAIVDKLNIDQPAWKQLSDMKQIHNFAQAVGYPVLVRPSYVLSGAAMSVVHTDESLDLFLAKAAKISEDAPVVVSKFETGAKEIEIDAVAYKGELLIYAIGEHIEHAGVHSGDATIVLPPQKLYLETMRRIKEIAKKIARELAITGPFNIQFLAKSNDVKVIECNLRASRSFPFASKVTGYNFIEIATKAMLQELHPKSDLLKKSDFRSAKTLDLDYVGVKVPQFSFPRLKGADPVLGVEMASTGEVACFGDDMYEAFLKAMISVGFVPPKKNILVSIGRMEDKADFLPAAEMFVKTGFTLFATEGTAQFLVAHGIKATMLHKIRSGKKPNLLDFLVSRKLDMVVNSPKNYSREEVTDGYLIRRKAIDLNIPLVTNVQVAKIAAEALSRYSIDDLKIKEWKEYIL